MQNEVILNGLLYNCILIKHTFTCISVADLGITNGGFEDFACKAHSEKCVARPLSVGVSCAASVHGVRCVLIPV